MHQRHRRILFLMFVASGACSLLYQVVWVRLAFASFGVITPMLSVVLSVFMLGIAIGSSLSGRIARAIARRGASPLRFYAMAEAAIGVGAFAVPATYRLGDELLFRAGDANSSGYLAASAVTVAISLLPWCIAMGATLPLGMAFVRDVEGDAPAESFSFLYLANVIGAMLGVALTAGALIEVLGFRGTLAVGAATNAAIAGAALWLAGTTPRGGASPLELTAKEARQRAGAAPIDARIAAALLFVTGFASMAMEVAWTRAYATVLGTEVYSFASLLFVYLASTWVGSLVYRMHLGRGTVRAAGWVVAALAPAALLPVIVVDPRWTHPLAEALPRADAALLLASLAPFCGVLGYLTPCLVDRMSGGDPGAAGRGYSANVLGCIVGPLAASYLFLPALGATATLVALTLPFVGFVLLLHRDLSRGQLVGAGVVSAAFIAFASLGSVSEEDPYVGAERAARTIRRDHTATVISKGTGPHSTLLVNGVPITELTQITAHMAHIPLAFHTGTPKSALAICFGMGTTWRALTTWGIDATAVELVPSVIAAFPYYYPDAPALIASPRSHLVVDDGRRFLRRTDQTFDVVTLDPPPPVEAAGSAMLYSIEFYDLVKRRLAPDGILQQWIPAGALPEFVEAALESVAESFPHVRVFRSVSGFGFHVLASRQPIPERSADELLARMPKAAVANLREHALQPIRRELEIVLAREVSQELVRAGSSKWRVTDDRPVNEYYLVRRLSGD